MDEFDHVFDTHAAVPNPVDEVRGDALYRVVIPRQNLIVRLNGPWPDIPEDKFLPAVRPYGIFHTGSSIRDLAHGLGHLARGSRRCAQRSLFVRFQGSPEGRVSEVLIATRLLDEQIRLGLRARHHLVSRVGRAG